MPRKKSNLNNACSRKARLQRALRARESEEETATRNATQRIKTAEIRAQESQEQRDKRLRQNVLRTRTARQQNIARFRELERTRQQTSRALTHASFFRLAFEYSMNQTLITLHIRRLQLVRWIKYANIATR